VDPLRIDPVVIPGDVAERIVYPDDEIWIRAAGHGDLQVADYTSTDRDGPPMHRHPWDEAQIVISGYAEFRIGGDDWVSGGSGTVQLLPRGTAHAVRVPRGEARLIQVSIGPPYDGFARAMAALFAEGASLDRIAATAADHGVTLGETPP
jgi:quercetin dioxygenase-like cupin family protein